MKFFNLFIAFIVLVGLQSCLTTSKTSTTKSMDIYGPGVIQKPVVVDLVVQPERVSGNATAYNLSIETVKQKAVSDALKKSGADVLVEPKFETETTSGRTVAIVTGFPATYSNFRPIEQGDVDLLQSGIMQKAEVYAPPSTESKKKSAGAIVATIVLLVAAAAVAEAAAN